MNNEIRLKMPENNIENKESFICYNCQTENFYFKNDYLNVNKLLEWSSQYPRKQNVIIYCEKCTVPNTVTIEY